MVKSISVAKKGTRGTKTETNGDEPSKLPGKSLGITVNGIKIPRKNLEFTCEQVKEIIGWETETEEVKFGSDYLLTDEYDKKVRCVHNMHNRPFTESRARRYASDVLNRCWAGCEDEDTINGETAIIGETGQVLSFQHRAIGFILACQIWEKGGERWRKLWSEEPKFYTLLVQGVSEKPRIVQTIDNVMPRTLVDVLYTSGYYANHKPNDRKALCRMTDYAIRLLWQRTGAKDNPFSPGATHSGCVEFLDRHSKVQDAVKHIYEENSDNSIGKYFSLGYCAGVLYLMATSGSDLDTYRLNDPHPNEKLLDWANWDKATDFWVMFSKGSPILRAVRQAFALLRDPTTGADIGSRAERLAILAKAWQVYKEGQVVEDGDIKLKYGPKTEDGRPLIEWPTFGGIDLGDAETVAEESEEETPEDDPSDPSEEEQEATGDIAEVPDDEDADTIEARKAEALKEKINETVKKQRSKKK